MKVFLFDLDGTLLSLDMKEFEKQYFSGLAQELSHLMVKEHIAKNVYLSYRYMVELVDERLNKERFYDKLVELSGVDRELMLLHEPDYYLKGFGDLQALTKPNSWLIKSVKLLKDKGYRLALATNPVFPNIATKRRIEWTGLNEEIFDMVTYFEQCYACKPQIQYFGDLLASLKVSASDCVMVGNDRLEDMVASTLGIDSILITDDAVGAENDFDYQRMSSEDFFHYVEKL